MRVSLLWRILDNRRKLGPRQMVKKALVLLIRVYQWTISPLLGPVCRFEPSCSRYAIACLESHGALRGSWLAIRRLARCHPFHPGGYDPPPLPPAQRSGQPSNDRELSAHTPNSRHQHLSANGLTPS